MDMKEKLVELQDESDICPERITSCIGCKYHKEYAFGNPCDVRAAIADKMIAHGVTVQGWISVKDRLPIEEAKAYEQEWCEEYPEFLVMIERGLLPTTLYYDLENNEWFRINTALKREKYNVTHWMPLPEPPKGE